MKKKYAIVTPNENDDYVTSDYVFYNKANNNFTGSEPDEISSLKKAIKICKESKLSTWIIEAKITEFSYPFDTFEDFIKYCKDSNLEVIETRPSIYASSETETAIPEKEVKFGYVIRYNAIYFLCEIKTYNDGLYAVNNISKSAIIFRKKKEAEFQAKVLKLKCNENFSVEKVNLNTFFKQ